MQTLLAVAVVLGVIGALLGGVYFLARKAGRDEALVDIDEADDETAARMKAAREIAPRTKKDILDELDKGFGL